ncbi:hypothetical protein ACWGK9_39155, partial [Streptomyces rubiginosohelvolus]
MVDRARLFHVKHVIALDVGGTGMKAALVGADTTLLHEARRPTERERGPEAVVAAILDFAAEEVAPRLARTTDELDHCVH